MSITIRTLTEQDLDIADEIQAAAYNAGKRRPLLEIYLRLQPDGWLLASLDGTPAGLAGAIDYGPIAYVGLVSVLPEMQRRGIARAMMAHLLDWLRERGNPIVLLDASDAGAPLYEALGFVDDEKTRVFTHDDCAQRPRDLETIAPLEAADVREVAALDAAVFGTERDTVFEQFHAFTPGRAFVARDEAGEVSGYLFAQQTTIGPWAARTPVEAEGLLARALRLEFDGQPRVLVPSSNGDAAMLLMSYGFSPRRSLRHMRLGGDGPVGQRALLYGLASFAIG